MSTLLDIDMDIFNVYAYSKKKRIGDSIDGGYIVGELDVQYDYYISADIALNDDFSVEFIKTHAMDRSKCAAFDGTVDGLPSNLAHRMVFTRKNIGAENTDRTTNLSDILETYTDVFVKMDIEGGEWEWLSSLSKRSLHNIAQLCIELHGITSSSWHTNFTFTDFNSKSTEKCAYLKQLASTHYLIHAHGNNADRTVRGIPNVIELTYINKKYFSVNLSLNTEYLPIPGLDFPNDKTQADISLHTVPFVHRNPFLIDIPDKEEYSIDEYIDIQHKLKSKNIHSIVESFYSHKNTFYTIDDFKRRISRGITQTLIDTSVNLLPTKHLYTLGTGGNRCIVCCTPFTHSIQDGDTRYIASQQILQSLEEVGYNGHFYLFNGGFPNPTGTEMKYAGVPYSFKIFMMLEAEKKGFTQVVWIDSGCYALNTPDHLFTLLEKEDVVLHTIQSSHYDAMVLDPTLRRLNTLTGCDIHSAKYIETIVFGLHMKAPSVKNIIKEYYDMVALGYPFFSIFPEEIVLSSIFNKPEYAHLVSKSMRLLQIHEKHMDADTARNAGYYFHHKDYSKYKKTCFISFDDGGGRFGNQLFRYMMCKVFTLLFGHTYVARDEMPAEYMCVNESNIYEVLQRKDIRSKNIVCQGYFQRSDLFIQHRSKLIDLLYAPTNTDSWKTEGKSYCVKGYLLDAKHSIPLRDEDIVLSLRLDDFLQRTSPTSDILPPEYYIRILEKMDIQKQKLYIVCDTLKYEWEYKYIEYFKKWNPILIQNTLQHDIALLRDCSTLLHSNSSLCWIISFLSRKTKRYIPYASKQYLNQNQDLQTIEPTDTLTRVTQLSHAEVYALDVNDVRIYPLSFCIPDECVVASIPEKTSLLASLIPGDTSTYIFTKEKEKEYNEMYRRARFAMTRMKGGWDCLRHYEILMNGCIPLFEDLDMCPKHTLTTYPKELNREAYALYSTWQENEEYIQKYTELCSRYLEHTRRHCTTSATAQYFLDRMKPKNVKNILLLTGHHGVNYNRETLWIGLKRYIHSINGLAVEYEPMPFLYEDFDNLSEHKYYGNNCFTFPKRLPKDGILSEEEIIDKIKSNFWDIIIYGKVGPDEFCTFPLYDIVTSYYNKDKIAFIFGGDEIFNLTCTDRHSYHINMFNRPIYYYPYVDYLKYYSRFGTCFVRELEC